MSRWQYLVNTMLGPECSASECMDTIYTAVLTGGIGYSAGGYLVLRNRQGPLVDGRRTGTGHSSKTNLLAAFGSLLLLLSLGDARQAYAGPASQLIQSLSESPPKGPIIGTSGCGETVELRRERRVAAEIVQVGQTAVPDLERAFTSMEKSGSRSKFFMNGGWLMFSYARIQGPAAVTVLRRMMKNAKLSAYRRNLDDAMALALGLTSYVSDFADRAGAFPCRRPEPRNALDGMIASLERNDLPGLEASLAPRARNALDLALQARPWAAFTREIRHQPPGIGRAIGYRFDVQGPWSQPEETLEETPDYRGAPLAADNVVLETQFTNSEGKDCGKHTVEFRSVPDPLHISKYLIDNANLEDLLRAIAACAGD